MSNEWTQKELREAAKTAQPGSPDVQMLSVRQHADYLAYRQQLGWPNNRSISRRLVKPGARHE